MKIDCWDDVEELLREKYSEWEGEDIIAQKGAYKNQEIGFENFIDLMCETVMDYLDGIEFIYGSELPEIDKRKWQEWEDDYKILDTSQDCPRCGSGQGCNFCLMTGW